MNIASVDLGTIPLYSSDILYLNPSIVCVFPVPVWPYANIVPFKFRNHNNYLPLYPSNTDSTIGNAVSLYTCSYVESEPNTLSNANYFSASP